MRSTTAVHRAALLAAVLALLLAAPVAAAPLVRIHLSGTDSFTEELCDEEWSVESSFTTLSMLKAGKHGDPTPSFFANESYRNLYRDPADESRGFVLSGHSLFSDIHVTLVSGTLYRFDSMQVGRPIVVSSLDGRVIGADRGRLAWQFLVDTHGSSDPDDYELLDASVVASSGPHPIGDAPCGLIAEAIQE
jgi:hypothetical protein